MNRIKNAAQVTWRWARVALRWFEFIADSPPAWLSLGAVTVLLTGDTAFVIGCIIMARLCSIEARWKYPRGER